MLASAGGISGCSSPPMPSRRPCRWTRAPIDVLKVAHHGSEDAGLAALLDRIRPRLAVISVGAESLRAPEPPRTVGNRLAGTA